MTPKEIILQYDRELGKLERQYPNSFCCLWNGVGSFFQYSLSKIDMLSNEEPLLFMWGDSAKVVLTSHRLHLFKSGFYYPLDLKDVNIKSCISGIIVCSGEYKSFKQVVLPIELFKTYDMVFWTNLFSKMAQAAKSTTESACGDSYSEIDIEARVREIVVSLFDIRRNELRSYTVLESIGIDNIGYLCYKVDQEFGTTTNEGKLPRTFGDLVNLVKHEYIANMDDDEDDYDDDDDDYEEATENTISTNSSSDEEIEEIANMRKEELLERLMKKDGNGLSRNRRRR